jgi:hypothetical protein
MTTRFAVVDASLGELLADSVLQQAVSSSGLTPGGFRTLLHDLAARIPAARMRRPSSGRPTGGS